MNQRRNTAPVEIPAAVQVVSAAVKAGPVALDVALLVHVAGGAGPHGGWISAAGPHGGWISSAGPHGGWTSSAGPHGGWSS